MHLILLSCIFPGIESLREVGIFPMGPLENWVAFVAFAIMYIKQKSLRVKMSQLTSSSESVWTFGCESFYMTLLCLHQAIPCSAQFPGEPNSSDGSIQACLSLFWVVFFQLKSSVFMGELLFQTPIP